MNRRMGGGPRGNNRSFQQPFQSGGMGGGGGGGLNPWQGGGSNMNQGGILSQLTSNPQLALALTSLLAPQQQQPPSLLSLNTSPAFSHNRDYGRFNSGINRGRDIRRHEPYNKNRGGGFGGDRRRRSPPRRDFNKKNDNRNDNKKPEKKNEKKKDDDTTEDGADDEKKETKRDWKDEKNQAEGKESGDEAEPSSAKKDGDSKDGKYVGVPSKYLHCFVCNKQMWDGESMQKHVRGRAHHEMLKALEESIQICVNILRENLRLAEERKMIEFNRQGRQRKFQRREPPLSHCSMCDLKFMGKIISHRRTDGHQRLKRYLHPSCRICAKEYPSRIEWIEHCLTPEHLKRSSESTESRIGGKDGDEIVEPGAEEDVLDDPNRLEPLLDEGLHMEADDPIVEIDGALDSMSSRLPAYKKERPVASGSIKEFSGFKCELCNRSFVDKEDADGHLTTKRHFYRFIDFIKERFDKEEKQKKAEKEAADKKKKEDSAKAKEEDAEVKEDGDNEEEAEDEAEADQEMYDPAETTEETGKTANGDAEEEEEEAEETEEPVAENKMEVVDEVLEEEEEEKPEPEPEPKKEKKEEVKKEPATPKPTTRKSLAGPKSRRGKK